MNFTIIKSRALHIAAAVIIAVTTIVLLVKYEKEFRFTARPVTFAQFKATEINGFLNYIENRNGCCRFSIIYQPGQLYQASLTPITGGSGTSFIQRASINNFITKHAGSDTLILFKNNAPYCYRIGN